jgi:hypothetical protein
MTSETLINLYWTARRYNPEDSHLLSHRRENLKSYELILLFNSLHTYITYYLSNNISKQLDNCCLRTKLPLLRDLPSAASDIKHPT